jgi:hypothetical protein
MRRIVGKLKTVLCIGMLMFAAARVGAEDWPQFRGPEGTGVSAEVNLPLHWSRAENVRWKADLPGRGVSGPVVAGGRVYVTGCTTDSADFMSSALRLAPEKSCGKGN